MKNLLKIELKKAFFSKSFLAGFGILMLCAFCSALFAIENWGDYNPNYLYEYCMKDGSYTMNPDFPLYNLFSTWIGADTMSLAGTLFYYLMPVGAALPYAWSFHTERKSGYLKNIVSRAEKKRYFPAKLTAVFLSGAAVVLLACLINILIVSAFLPVGNNTQEYTLYNLIYFGNLWADLFFTHPFLHMALYVLLNGLYGGIFALLSAAVSFYVKNLPALLLTPFLVLLLAGYVHDVIRTRFFPQTLNFPEFVPTQFLHARTVNCPVFGWAVALVTLLLLGFALGTILWRGFKDEIY